MSSVIKLQSKVPVRSAPGIETEGFLSFEDFWQSKDEKAGVPPPEPVKSPQEIAREEVAEILRLGREEAEKIRGEAEEQGFAKGEAAGLAAGQKNFDERIAALDTVLTALDGEREAFLRHNEEEILPLIKAMVDRLVHHEVSVNPMVIQACLREAMAYVVENSTVRIHLHSEDFARIKRASLENQRLIEGKNRIQLVEDSNISLGGCLLKTDFGEIDATLDTQKDKLYQAIDQAFLAALAATEESR